MKGDIVATIEKALEIAAKAHAGQIDRGGAPYIMHVLRVMINVTTPDARIAAVLHDVVEDTDITLDDLREAGFADEIIATVRCLTRTAGVGYADYVVGVKPNAVAREVKLADLHDNSRLERNVVDIERFDADRRRIAKYLISYKFLTDHLDEVTYRSLMRDLEDR